MGNAYISHPYTNTPSVTPITVLVVDARPCMHRVYTLANYSPHKHTGPRVLQTSWIRRGYGVLSEYKVSTNRGLGKGE